MKITIEIPEEFEIDYKTDKFKDFFQRVLADMDYVCGNYERETAEMLIKAFESSNPVKEAPVKDEECKAYVHTYKCDADNCVDCDYREINPSNITMDTNN